MFKEREPKQELDFENHLRIIFGNNPAIPYAVSLTRDLIKYVDDEFVMRNAGETGAFNLPDIAKTGNPPYVEKMNRLLLQLITSEQTPDFYFRLGEPGINDLTSAAVAQHSADRLAKKSRKFEIRGSFEKLGRLGVPQGYFSPQRIAREAASRSDLIKDETNTRSKRILEMVMEGPNVDTETGILPERILKHLEHSLGKQMSKQTDFSEHVNTEIVSFPLKEVTHPSDPRTSFLVRLNVNSNNKQQQESSDLTLSFNWTDREDSGDINQYDGRFPGYYYIEQYRSEIKPDVDGRLKIHPSPLPDDCPEGTIYFFGDNLVSQSLSHITRFILDQCAFGDQILLRNSSTDQNSPITMDKMLRGIDMWDEEFPGIPDDFRDFYDDIPKRWDEFKFDTFRGDEYVSRLMVSYGLDPFRFVAATHATGLLPHLKLHGFISEHGGLDSWVRKIAKSHGVGFTESAKTSEILSQLSNVYRSKRDKMKPGEYAWFTSKYIDPLAEIQLDWDDSIDLVIPWFMDEVAREPIPEFYL